MITRFSILPDERKVLLGIDKAGLFEVGVVYEATKIMGEIVLKPIGKYTLENENSSLTKILYEGMHLITKEESSQIIQDTLKNNIMKTFELTPNNGRKTFYGKCFVKETDNNYTLVSYHTEVAWYDKIDKRFTNTKNESNRLFTKYI